MNSLIFEDFDAYAEAIQNANVKIMLQNYQDMFWQLKHFAIGGRQVQFGIEGSGTIVEGCSDSGGLVLFGVAPGVMGHANGSEVNSTSAFLIEPGQEFCISATTGSQWFTVFIPGSVLAELGYDCLGRPSRIVNGNSRHAADLRNYLSQFSKTMERHPEILNSAAETTAGKEVDSMLAKILGVQAETNGTGRPRISRNEIIKRSLDHIDQHIGSCMRVDQLSDAADVTDRTLRTAFLDWFGVAPIRYMRLRQLHEIRRILQNSHPDDTSVSEVLTQQGVWEFGRFAARYRNLFSELPSVALNRRT